MSVDSSAVSACLIESIISSRSITSLMTTAVAASTDASSSKSCSSSSSMCCSWFMLPWLVWDEGDECEDDVDDEEHEERGGVNDEADVRLSSLLVDSLCSCWCSVSTGADAAVAFFLFFDLVYLDGGCGEGVVRVH